MEEKLTRKEIIAIANKTLAFVASEVGQNPPLINLVLDEAKNQDAIEDRLFINYSCSSEFVEY